MKCKKCKKKESLWGCSQLNSPYCFECHNKRNIIKRIVEHIFYKIPIHKFI